MAIKRLSRPLLLCALGLVACGVGSTRAALGQSGPTPLPPWVMLVDSDFIDNDAYFAAVSAGAGWVTQGSGYSPAGEFVVAAGLSNLLRHHGFTGTLGFVEAGALGPLPDRAAPAAFVGFNLGINQDYSTRPHNLFFATAGIDYVVGAAGALNAGVGVDHYYRKGRAVRFELRDYVIFTERPVNHVALRVGWVFTVHNP